MAEGEGGGGGRRRRLPGDLYFSLLEQQQKAARKIGASKDLFRLGGQNRVLQCILKTLGSSFLCPIWSLSHGKSLVRGGNIAGRSVGEVGSRADNKYMGGGGGGGGWARCCTQHGMIARWQKAGCAKQSQVVGRKVEISFQICQPMSATYSIQSFTPWQFFGKKR